jgi:energy-coupling factor transporter ATP-binding protein EcfA2
MWREVVWQRPFKPEAVEEMLIHLAGLSERGPIVWEIRGNSRRIRYLLGCEKEYYQRLKQTIEPHGKIHFYKAEQERQPIAEASHLRVSKPQLALKTDNALATIRAVLAAINQIRTDDELVLQMILGPPIRPSPMPHDPPDPHASWLDVALGNVGIASQEARLSIKERVSNHGFACCVRAGSTRENMGVGGMFTALRTLETAGVKLHSKPCECEKVHDCHVPWHFPLQLSVKELVSILLLPIGEEDLPGAPGLHPKLILPPTWYSAPTGKANDRTFALAMNDVKLSISPKDSLEHTHILGPTGSGKSTAMRQLALADIKAGRGVLVIDPKADLVNDILARMPEGRDKDVVILDPSDPCPVGFNPLAYGGKSPTLVADAILSVFKEVFAENWGIRSQDVMSATLLTLAQVPGASLLWLPTILTDEAFRLRVTSQIRDPIGLEPFWAGFAAMKDSERRQEIAPVLNKIRQFLLRPGLRNVLGQANPKFNIADLFNKRCIVLVPLNKGQIGGESARLLGSLIVGLTWTLALGRANLPPEQRHLVSIYIDELQDYLSLPTDLSDALAQARGLGVGLTLAHQYREQLPPEIRAGVDANTRNKIVFGLNSADAKAMAAMAPELEPQDFMELPRYQIYTSFQCEGKATGWVQGQTMPPPAPTRQPVELRAKSMAAYGKSAEEVEAEYLAQLGYTVCEKPVANELDSDRTQRSDGAPPQVVGRRKKPKDDGGDDA